MNIALIYSPDWKQYMPIQLFSIFTTNPPPVKVYLITDRDGFFDCSTLLSHFANNYEVQFIDAQELYSRKITSQLNVSSRFTKYALYRLLLPELIADERLLYIDADTLVCGDLQELYEADFEANWVIGALDTGADKYNLKTPIGLKKHNNYINAGVLLLHLKAIRNHQVDKAWIYEANTKKYAAHDQCIINKTCKGKIKLMGNEYNCSVSTGLNIPIEAIKIMHWAGKQKVWQTSAVPNPRLWFDAVRNYKKLLGGTYNG